MSTTPEQDANLLTALKTWVLALVTPPSGSVTITPPPGGGGGGSAYPDGSDKAPTGTGPFLNYFTRYPTRPPWKVPGVDYRTGINTGIILKDPKAGGLPTGVEPYYAGNQSVNVSGQNVTLDGWDFTGIQLLIGANAGTDKPDNIIIRNCKFNRADCPAVNAAWGNCGKLTIEYCDISGENINEGLVNWYPKDSLQTLVMQYNWIHGNPGDGPNYKRGGYIVFKYNVMYNQAMGPLSHLDQMVCGDGPLDFQAPIIDYNFFLSDANIAAGNGTQGMSWDGNYHNTSFVVSGGSVSNNVWINHTTGPDPSACITYGLRIETTLTRTGTEWHIYDNYIDDTGGAPPRGFGWQFVRNTTFGPQRGRAILARNINLIDGTQPPNWNRTIA